MPLRLASKIQVSGHWFTRSRLAHALQRRSVRMDPNPSRTQRLVLVLSAVLAAAVLLGGLVIGWFRPAGAIDSGSKIVADRANDAVWVVVAGRLHPALNLVSAQLIAGSPDKPTFVSPAEIAKWPKGPVVGITGAPTEAIAVNSPAVSRWAICDTAPDTVGGTPTVTAIDGRLTLDDGAAQLGGNQALLLTYGGQTYLVADGKRAPLDLTDAAVAAGLGIPADAAAPPMSRALYDALPAAPRIAVPSVPGAGDPGPDLGRPLPVGAVIASRDVDVDHFYAVLADGVQEVSPVVAAMLRHRDSHGLASPPQISPDKLARIPRRHALDIDTYPAKPVHLADAAAQPVSCAAWQQDTAARRSSLTVITGRALPLTHDQQNKLVPLVGAGGADRVALTADAATFVTTTGEAPDSPARGTLWLISPTGSRYGVPFDDNSLQGLGLKPADARPAPWAMLRAWPAGPELSRAAALTQHSPTDAAALSTKPPKEQP